MAVAGAGAFGREHLRVLSRMPAVEIAGIADSDEATAAAAAKHFGVRAKSLDANELVSRLQPDGLIVATPGPTHVALARHALRLGIPVLVEKPVGMNADDAASLAEDAARSGAFVLPGHILRFSDAHRRFVEMARSPAVGNILSVTARRHRDDTHAVRYADDPVLMTMIHDIDLALWITGTAATGVIASRRPRRTPRSETVMTGKAGSAIWRLSTAWTFPAASCPPDRIEVIGAFGSVELEAGVAIRSYGNSPRQIDLSGADADQPLEAELAYFTGCIASRTRPGLVTLADAVAGLKVADAILASLRDAGDAT